MTETNSDNASKKDVVLEKKWFMFMKNPEFIVPVCISVFAVLFSALLYCTNLEVLGILEKDLETNKVMLETNKGMLETNEETLQTNKRTLDVVEREFNLRMRPYVGVDSVDTIINEKEDKIEIQWKIINVGAVPAFVSHKFLRLSTDNNNWPISENKPVRIILLPNQFFFMHYFFGPEDITSLKEDGGLVAALVKQEKTLFYDIEVKYRHLDKRLGSYFYRRKDGSRFEDLKSKESSRWVIVECDAN